MGRAQQARVHALDRRVALARAGLQARPIQDLQLAAAVANEPLVTKLASRGAYLRIMSVASLERQLAPSEAGDVALRPYLETLCERIGASLIVDRTKIVLVLEMDERTVPADLAISIGLIATELVINALKHAFPDGRKGKVTIGCRPCGAGWALTVCDDGAGRRVNSTPSKGGLGATIIAALAKQHRAKVETTDLEPGTMVSILFGSA